MNGRNLCCFLSGCNGKREPVSWQTGNTDGNDYEKSKTNLKTAIVGRYAMTCCAQDLSVFGFICDYDRADKLELDDWVTIQAVVNKDYAEKFDLWYPVLTVFSCKKCGKPEKEVVDIA